MIQKRTLPYIQGLSERFRRALKKFQMNVFSKNYHKLENLYVNKKDSEQFKNLSKLVSLLEKIIRTMVGTG